MLLLNILKLLEIAIKKMIHDVKEEKKWKYLILNIQGKKNELDRLNSVEVTKKQAPKK